MPANENQNLDAEIASLLSRGEGLSLEFKSDLKTLSDRDLVAAVVALANTEGGLLLLGVEDNGTVTGLHPSHQDLTALPALIANRTIPSLAVRVTRAEFNGRALAQIVVPKSRQLVSTSDGLQHVRRDHRRALHADRRRRSGFSPDDSLT